jgi:hypothetical protein
MTTLGWYNTGAMTPEENQKLFSPTTSKQTSRFWLKEGEKRTLVFVDGADDGFRTKEHELEIGGKFGFTFTCRQGLDPQGRKCPLCLRAEAHKGKGGAYGVSFFTILDLTPWTSREGKEIPWSIRLLPCKKDALTKLMTIRKEMLGGALPGWKFVFMRSPRPPGQDMAKTAKIGDIYQSVERVDVSKVIDGRTQKPVVPFDYIKILEPKSHEELTQLAAQLEAGSVSTDLHGHDDSEAVPYSDAAAPAAAPVPSALAPTAVPVAVTAAAPVAAPAAPALALAPVPGTTGSAI